MNQIEIPNNIPKKAYSKPGVACISFLIIIVVLWVPHTLPLFKNMASVQIFAMFAFLPLAIGGLFLSYYTGLSLAKFNFKRVARGKLHLPYLILFIIHIICIGLCIVHELALAGYPFKMCFDYCYEIEMPTAIIVYSIVSTIMFLPAYYAIYQYRRWILKYDLTRFIKG